MRGSAASEQCGCTLDVGYDIRVAENLWLRPILNGAYGYTASDASLFGAFVQYRPDVDISPLTDSHANACGLGGSLTLADYNYRRQRDIDVELRCIRIYLETFGDILAAAW